MRVKLTFALLIVLTLLGGLNLYESLKNRLLPEYQHEEMTAVKEYAPSTPLSTGYAADGVMMDERFKVSSGDALDISVQHSDVRIETDATNEARIIITLEGHDMELAQAYFEEMHFTIAQEGNTIHVRTDRSSNHGWSFSGNGGAHIQVVAHIPRRFDAEIKTSHGNVQLGDLEGSLDLNTSHGDVTATTLSGPLMELTTSHGKVRAEALTSDELRVTTTHGDIQVARVESGYFTAQTSHSDVDIDQLHGPSKINTSHGDIRIRLDQSADTQLRTSHGSIEITAPSNLAAELDLKGERVHLSSSFSFVGTLEKDRAEGRLGAGGARIDAQTSHGDVTIKQQ